MIYFDNNATTCVAPEVLEAMLPFLQGYYGNPSPAHTFGRENRAAVEAARREVAELIGAGREDEVVFTSCGTEADNWAILGALRASPHKRHIITTRVEHEAVRTLCEKLEDESFEVTWLEVNESGGLDQEALKRALREDTAIVSVMLANNETGILFPVNQLAQIVKENSGALFHCDGVNATGKIPINLRDSAVDLFSLSGHKFYAPKGIGALYVRSGTLLPPLFIGGGQELARRPGTEAVHQIVGIGKAADLARNSPAQTQMRKLRDKLEDGILAAFPNARLNGTADREKRLSNTSSISFSGLNGESILAGLNDQGIYVSTGSACNSENHRASAVLQAMDIAYTDAMGSIRFSLGRYNTEVEVDFVLAKLPEIVGNLQLTAA
jgi:cysteine desulfurase